MFNSIFDNENIQNDIGKTNKIETYPLLIYLFKKMINRMEDHCSLEDIMEVRDFFDKKIIEAKKMTASVLIDSNNDHSKYISVT